MTQRQIGSSPLTAFIDAPTFRPEGKASVRLRSFAKPIGTMTFQNIEKATPPDGSYCFAAVERALQPLMRAPQKEVLGVGFSTPSKVEQRGLAAGQQAPSHHSPERHIVLRMCGTRRAASPGVP